MNFRSWLRSSVILIVLMIGILLLGASVGANVGPIELGLWFVLLVIGLILCSFGSRRKTGS